MVWATLVPQMVERSRLQFRRLSSILGREDLLEKGMAAHSSILVWRMP